MNATKVITAVSLVVACISFIITAYCQGYLRGLEDAKFNKVVPPPPAPIVAPVFTNTVNVKVILTNTVNIIQVPPSIEIPDEQTDSPPADDFMSTNGPGI